MRYFSPLVLAMFLVGAASAGEEIWMCEANTVVRIFPGDDGLFRVREQETHLRILIDKKGLAVYEYEGEVVFKPSVRFKMECTWQQNRPVLCLGDQSEHGRTLGRDSFELRDDNTFLLHQIGIRSSELDDGFVTIDKITVGQCSISSLSSNPE